MFRRESLVSDRGCALCRYVLQAVLFVVIAHTQTVRVNGARFAAMGQLGNSTISVTGFDNLTFTPTWSFDFETDGQSILFHQFDVSFDGIVAIPDHSQVWIDLHISASRDKNTYDINPVAGPSLWQFAPYFLGPMQISGTYHSFEFLKAFSTVTGPGGNFYMDTQLTSRTIRARLRLVALFDQLSYSVSGANWSRI